MPTNNTAVGSVTLKIGKNAEFDARLEEARRDQLPDGGDIEIITKTNGTVAGKSVAMLTFTVDDNGKRKRVQTVTTLRVLASLADALRAIADAEEHLQ